MRLRTRSQFQRMDKQAFRFKGVWILVDVKATREPFSRLGITATKKFGDAPKRNRFKRLVREAFRLSCSRTTPSFDMVIRPRTAALNAGREDIQQEMIDFLEKASRLISSPQKMHDTP